MRVAALAQALKHSRFVNGPADLEITDVTNDSRQVRSGSLYAALPGERVDGHRFIDPAIASGARAVLCERIPQGHEGDEAHGRHQVAWFTADHARLALSEVAHHFHDRPSEELEVIGVTGTDGKTSTVYFAHQLLQHLTASSAFLSTASMQIGSTESPNMQHQSTPEAPIVHRALREMCTAGARYAVLESTSHGLSRKTCRLAHVRYRTAVFTNLSHEHLEFHGSFEQYRSDKANLFRALDAGSYAEADQPPVDREPITFSGSLPELAPPALPICEPFGVLNADDSNAPYFAWATSQPLLTYALGREAHYTARDLELETTGSRFTLVTPAGEAPAEIRIPGRFNVANALAAAAAVQGVIGCTAVEIAQALPELRPVPGRMSVVLESPFSVVVDYAHTPGSFENVLPFFRKQTSGRLIVVFGSAGERDVAKRPVQGALADRYADVIVLADEDPRGEEPMSILEEIAAGIRAHREGDTLFLIPDRREAISRAISIAGPGDTVLLLGKGHEASIITAVHTVPWNEHEVAQEELRALGLV